MVLLRKLAEHHAPGSELRRAHPKLWDSVFICVDVEARNGRNNRLTEFGFSWLDSRRIENIHNLNFDERIKASHLIIKGAVPKMDEEGDAPRF